MGRGRGSAEGAETLAALPGLLAATHVSKLTLGSDDAGLRFSIADGDQTKTVFEALINTLHALDGQVAHLAERDRVHAANYEGLAGRVDLLCGRVGRRGGAPDAARSAAQRRADRARRTRARSTRGSTTRPRASALGSPRSAARRRGRARGVGGSGAAPLWRADRSGAARRSRGASGRRGAARSRGASTRSRPRASAGGASAAAAGFDAGAAGEEWRRRVGRGGQRRYGGHGPLRVQVKNVPSRGTFPL